LWLILIENIASLREDHKLLNDCSRSRHGSILPAATVGAYNFNVTASLHFIQPCNPISAKQVPAGDGWLHEPKLDGYRLQVLKDGPAVRLLQPTRP